MFWECHVVTSSIDKLLDQPEDQIRLQDLLDESDLIQECLNQNQRLLNYLIQPQTMKELIHCIITLPSNDDFRNANVVSELLSGDFQRIQETLLENEHCDLLYSFLSSKNESTLNPILASYFSRIFITLIIRKPHVILKYFKSRDTFQDDFLRHLDSTSIADILYRLVADSGEQRPNAIQWYEEINLIDGLVQAFLTAESTAVQINIGNLLSEFLRLAFDQQSGLECDIMGPTLSSTIERLLSNSNQDSILAKRLSSSGDDEHNSANGDTEARLTPVALAEHILSKSNLEKIFDALTQSPALVANGCDFLDNILDLLSRHLPVPICLSLAQEPTPSSNDSSSSTKDESERMQINDIGDTLPVTKSNENATKTVTLVNLARDPLVRIYLTLLEVIPTRLPSLIAFLSSPCPPLTSSLHNQSPAVKQQFINQPLGSLRLNLIKFFAKLIYTISNDQTGDQIYQILNSNRLFHILIDLFHQHIYNNFLHTQLYLIIRLLVHINSIAVKQPNDIWTRTSLADLDPSSKSELPNSSPFHYTNRCSYQLLQSLLKTTEVNLFERLLDQYESTMNAKKPEPTGSSSDNAASQTRFSSPNSGHIAQILRCLRDHAANFDHYSSFLKSSAGESIDDESNSLEMRWGKVLDYLAEDEKKCAAMHPSERQNTSTFRIASATNATTHNNLNDSSEADYRRQAFHMRSFGSSGAAYADDDDDDEAERCDIDDIVMSSDQKNNERKVEEMKKISFEPQFPPVFDEQTLWHQQEKSETKSAVKDHDDQDKMQMTSPPTLPDLFAHHRAERERETASSSPSNESSFEQLCSFRTNDHSNDSVLFPLQSSSAIRDEALANNDEFWRRHPVHLVNSHASAQLTQSSSSSSEEDADDEAITDSPIPEDEDFFVRTEVTGNEIVGRNNMMDIFQRQSSVTLEKDGSPSKGMQEPVRASTPERDTHAPVLFSSHEDEDHGRALQDNFSFLIARGLLKTSSH